MILFFISNLFCNKDKKESKLIFREYVRCMFQCVKYLAETISAQINLTWALEEGSDYNLIFR